VTVPQVVSIAFTPRGVERRPTDHYARVPVERATLIEQRGIEGDLKAAKEPVLRWKGK